MLSGVHIYIQDVSKLFISYQSYHLVVFSEFVHTDTEIYIQNLHITGGGGEALG